MSDTAIDSDERADALRRRQSLDALVRERVSNLPMTTRVLAAHPSTAPAVRHALLDSPYEGLAVCTSRRVRPGYILAVGQHAVEMREVSVKD